MSSLSANAALRRLVIPPKSPGRWHSWRSDAASAMTGANVPVDCGWLAARRGTPMAACREANV